MAGLVMRTVVWFTVIVLVFSLLKCLQLIRLLDLYVSALSSHALISQTFDIKTVLTKTNKTAVRIYMLYWIL